MWEFRRLSGDISHDQQWEVINVSRDRLGDAHIETPEGLDDPWIVPDAGFTTDDVDPGGRLTFQFVRRLGSPTSRVVQIWWTPPTGGQQQVQAETISTA